MVFSNPPVMRKAPFEPWEDAVIVRERLRMGNEWVTIAKELPGRTSCAVKNRWYRVLRKQHEETERSQHNSLHAVDIENLLSRSAP